MRFPSFNILRPKPATDGPEYADIYARALAAGIDLILIFAVLKSTFEIISDRIYAHVDKSQLEAIQQGSVTLGQFLNAVWYSHLGVLWAFNTVVQIIVIGVLIVAVQVLWGTTPGKWIMGLKVLHHKTYEPISGWRYALRYLAYIPALVPLMLGIFWITFNKRRRGWHDYIAGTVVLNTRPTGWYWIRIKRLYRKLRGREESRAVEEAVGEPSAEQSHQDGDKPVG